jgi:hypothetical protein
MAAKRVVKKPAPKRTAKATAKKAARTTSAASRAADRARVSTQTHEVAYVAKKFGVDAKVVTKAIAKVGNMREDVYAAIRTFKARSRAADKAQVSRQPHEIAHLARKFNLTTDEVLAAVDEHGRSRKKVEAALAPK